MTRHAAQIAFLQELCGTARHLQPTARAALTNKLIALGLFEARGFSRVCAVCVCNVCVRVTRVCAALTNKLIALGLFEARVFFSCVCVYVPCVCACDTCVRGAHEHAHRARAV